MHFCSGQFSSFENIHQIICPCIPGVPLLFHLFYFWVIVFLYFLLIQEAWQLSNSETLEFSQDKRSHLLLSLSKAVFQNQEYPLASTTWRLPRWRTIFLSTTSLYMHFALIQSAQIYLLYCSLAVCHCNTPLLFVNNSLVRSQWKYFLKQLATTASQIDQEMLPQTHLLIRD